jgi:hypothetical protein
MASTRLRHLDATVTPWAQFHAYVLGNVIGIRWGKVTQHTGMGNDALFSIAKEYLEYAAGDDEWRKLTILNAMRDKSAASIRDDARYIFPSLFPRHRKARALAVPDEISNEEVSFDPTKIETWKEQVREIKKEIAMSEDVLEQDVTEDGSEATKTGTTNSRVTVNFYVPNGVDLADLTLDNYRELTNKRYRMTKEQKARNLSREAAFEESKALATNQLGDSNE